MKRVRRHVSVTIDLDLYEAGQAEVEEGRAWSFSAWVNEALRQRVEAEQRPSGQTAPRPTPLRPRRTHS